MTPFSFMLWKNYIKHNTRDDIHYADCQLVTAINAYYYLTSKIIKQDSDKYRELAKLSGCIHGSCINITKSYDRLGICVDKEFEWYNMHEYLKSNCFMEVTVWHKKYGFHSVSIVDYSKKTDCIRVTNFEYETSLNGWMFFEDFRPFLWSNNSRGNRIRTFKLK